MLLFTHTEIIIYVILITIITSISSFDYIIMIIYYHKIKDINSFTFKILIVECWIIIYYNINIAMPANVIVYFNNYQFYFMCMYCKVFITLRTYL